MKNIFTHHPHSVGGTYWQHMKSASYFGINMLAGGFACMIHAILPFMFKKQGSELLLKMMHRFIKRSSYMEQRLINLAQLLEQKRQDLQIEKGKDTHC